MSNAERPQRGRPRLITTERIVDAGMAMTLPALTITGLAKRMGVNVGSLYKHVTGVEELQQIVAEGIIGRWEIPEPVEESFGDYLLTFSQSLYDLALANPGISSFFLYTTYRRTPLTLQRINAHHMTVAVRYELDAAHASIALSTIAEHALATAELRRGGREDERDYEQMGRRAELVALSSTARSSVPRDDAGRFVWSTKALIIGVQEMIKALPES